MYRKLEESGKKRKKKAITNLTLCNDWGSGGTLQSSQWGERGHTRESGGKATLAKLYVLKNDDPCF